MPPLRFSKKSGVAGVVSTILVSVLAVEGGWVNDPRDPGGETNMGITKEVAVAHGYTAPMKSLSVEVAKSIYYKDYIEKPGYVPMLSLSGAVSAELVDSAVNTGTSRASRWFQNALNSLSREGQDFPLINVDGKVGPGTITAYKTLQAKRGKVQACELVVKLMDAQQATYYMSLKSLNSFMVGWVTNRIGNVPLSACKEDD